MQMNNGFAVVQDAGMEAMPQLSLDQVIKLISYCSGQIDTGDWEEQLQHDPILAACWRENENAAVSLS